MVHRKVGRLDQNIEFRGYRRGERDTAARPDLQDPTLGFERLLQRLYDGVRLGHREIRIRMPEDQGAEFVATEAVELDARTDHGAEPISHGLQQLVADLVTIVVVHRLE